MTTIWSEYLHFATLPRRFYTESSIKSTAGTARMFSRQMVKSRSLSWCTSQRYKDLAAGYHIYMIISYMYILDGRLSELTCCGWNSFNMFQYIYIYTYVCIYIYICSRSSITSACFSHSWHRLQAVLKRSWPWTRTLIGPGARRWGPYVENPPYFSWEKSRTKLW